ncbi:MAG: amidohydrolase family protein [Chitinophagaceae bacterium]|nr:amidohydrolase family protein [Chitinophagaceae bacterium]
MRYLTADLIFDGTRFLSNEYILKVDEDGRIISLSPSVSSDFPVEYYKGLLMPGLINAHCHLELSHMKGRLPEKTGLVQFLTGINQFRNHTVTDEEKQYAIRQAEQEMIKNGIVAVGDICNTLDTLAIKQAQNLQYYSFSECFGLIDLHASQRFNHSLQISNAFKVSHESSVVLHAPYSAGAELIRLVNDLTSASSVSTMHNQESMAEQMLFESGQGEFIPMLQAIVGKEFSFSPTGKSSLQSILPKLPALQHLILVHNTFSSNEDISLAQNSVQQLFWCLCPKANLYIENTLPDVHQLIASNATIVLGTDSLASNNSLNILEEIDVLHDAFPELPISTMLQWASLNGAKALNMQDKLGSFEPGKIPGVFHIENMHEEGIWPKERTIQRIF